ncbi:hypothetical protein ACF08M_41255 [Streptomyces sp. NPDC015032]|uniref:hypothetical protein n=1 Tax=Streptomyces sp. NPDC015032 TaxID=3364937 RepID=UPI0037008CAB
MRSLRANEFPVPEIARKLGITSGKNQGKRPSGATAYRLLVEAEASDDTDVERGAFDPKATGGLLVTWFAAR